MSFDPNKPVSLEEYNQTVRDSVNAYYQHAMNDPSMSKEEVMQSTTEMSEKYLEAVQEFQEAQAMQNEAPVNTNEAIQTGDEVVEASGISTADTEAIDTGVADDAMDI